MKKFVGLVSIILSVVFWGISFISTAQILHVVDPVILGFFRYILAVIFVGIVVLVRRVNLRITKADLIIFFLAGLLGIFLYSVLENTALTIIPSSSAAIITAITPMMVVFGNFLVFREKITVREVFLIILSIIGVVLVMYADLIIATGWNELIGYLLMLASIVSWTVYSLLTKKIGQKYSGIKITAIQSFMALLIFIPTLFFFPLPDFSTFVVNDWANLLFLGVVCSGLCYFLYIHSVNVLGVTLPNLFLNFIPIITILTNLIVFKVAVNWLQIVGAVIITISMSVMTIINFKKTPTNNDGLENKKNDIIL
ncbi:MAG: DMT family transporter [Candidatus Izemoplasmatales bacterium]|nr:DMT family transporter [Candidatus Izemoplasmatales bacterium]